MRPQRLAESDVARRPSLPPVSWRAARGATLWRAQCPRSFCLPRAAAQGGPALLSLGTRRARAPAAVPGHPPPAAASGRWRGGPGGSCWETALRRATQSFAEVGGAGPAKPLRRGAPQAAKVARGEVPAREAEREPVARTPAAKRGILRANLRGRPGSGAPACGPKSNISWGGILSAAGAGPEDAQHWRRCGRAWVCVCVCVRVFGYS